MLLRVGSAEVGGLIEVVEFDEPATWPGRRSPASTSAGAGACASAGGRRARTSSCACPTASPAPGIFGWLAERVAAPTVRGHLRAHAPPAQAPGRARAAAPPRGRAPRRAQRRLGPRLRSTVATASAAAPSPRPTKPMPSPVVAFTLTCAPASPSAAASARADRLAVRRRASARSMHDRRVDVVDRAAARRRPAPPTVAQQLERVGVSPALVGVGEVLRRCRRGRRRRAARR